jgi:capsular polysaccharide transport system ATP-binding protein
VVAGDVTGIVNPARAIVVRDLVMEFPSEAGPKRVLDGINFRVEPGERLAILGRNGAGKSTLIKILAGLQRPTAGSIERGLNMSWPLALGGGFEGEMTGYDNVKFIARLYRAPFAEVMEYVSYFTELGRDLQEPMRLYSDGMRMRLAFALSLAIDFECLLIDEVILVGDARFQDKCREEIFDRRKRCAIIMAAHAVDIIEEYCDHALVLKDGRGRVFEDVKLATGIYATL